MSHYSVTVVCKSPDDLEQMLAPYDENIETESYWEPFYDADKAGTVAEYVEYVRSVYADPEVEYADWQQTRLLGTPLERATAEQLLTAWTSQRLRDGEHGIEVESTYNPHSKWDYWRIGGRWSGFYPIKEEHGDALQVLRPSMHWEFEREPDSSRFDGTKADGGPKHMLDLDAKTRASVARAQDEVAEARQRLVDAGLPMTSIPWPGTGHDTNDAREQFWQQPAVALLHDIRDHDSGLFMMNGPDLAGLLGDPERWVQRAARRAYATYAMCTPEGWIAPGEMGWWGSSSDQEDDRRETYWQRFTKIVEAVPDDWYLIVVDCHI